MQGDIPPSRRSHDLTFLYLKTGLELRHHDWWSESSFLYVGKDHHRAQLFIQGNKAIRDHGADGQAIRHFECSSDEVTYMGEFNFDSAQT